MRLTVVALSAGIAAWMLTISAAPADAAANKRLSQSSQGGPAFSAQSRPRQARQIRARSRIVVRPRSYLDAGTEVYPGSKGYTDYVFPPGYTAFSNFDPTGASRYPLPNAFELRSYHAPGSGY
jgi:hypothetical protein